MSKLSKSEQGLLTIIQKVARKDQRFLRAFLYDLLSPAEYADIVNRWQLIKALDRGLTQREIASQLNISIAKVTRGSKALQESKGGFKKALKL